jgi:hypothetical protein
MAQSCRSLNAAASPFRHPAQCGDAVAFLRLREDGAEI